jgi:hypothetical protein
MQDAINILPDTTRRGGLDQTDLRIIELHLAGMDQRAIGRELGLSHVSVGNRLRHKAVLREAIQSAQAVVINSTIADVIGNIKHAIKNYQSTDDVERRRDGRYFTARMAESVGILTSRAPSVFVQQIFNQVNVQIDARIQALATGFAPVASNTEIIDVDYGVDDGI